MGGSVTLYANSHFPTFGQRSDNTHSSQRGLRAVHTVRP
jgi:hypothetical protein